jgi:hypothetical protein
MNYVSTYTVPAWEESISSFKNYKCYFFSDIWDGKFNIDDMKKSDYLGLWTPHKTDDWSYVKIKHIWSIQNIDKFEIDYNDSEITFKDLSLNSDIQRAFKVHIDAFHRYSNWSIWADTPLSWNYILVSNSIKIEENILYPTREVIPFALNLDNEGQYVQLNNFVNTVALSDNISLNTKNNYLVIDWEKIEITWVNAPVYSLILKKLYSTDEKIFSFTDELDDFKKIKNNIKSDYDYLNWTLTRGFNNSVWKYLPFQLSFNKNKWDYTNALFIENISIKK